jgi:hypothetical protein
VQIVDLRAEERESRKPIEAFAPNYDSCQPHELEQLAGDNAIFTVTPAVKLHGSMASDAQN